MPFVAEGNKGEGWERIDIAEYKLPKVALNGYELRCQDEDCQAGMIIKHGGVLTPHFAHVANRQAANCAYAGVGESEEHRQAKLTVAEKLRRLTTYENATVSLEKIVRTGDKKRIVDVYAIWPDGSTAAHEIQLAKTTIKECQERTNDYYAAGIGTVVWWFGNENIADASLRHWALHECGYAGIVRFTESVVTL